MSNIRDLLHDRIDTREELARNAREKARSVINGRLQEALDQTDTIKDALSLLAVWLAEEMDKQTTEAVRAGAKSMQKLLDVSDHAVSKNKKD